MLEDRWSPLISKLLWVGLGWQPNPQPATCLVLKPPAGQGWKIGRAGPRKVTGRDKVPCGPFWEATNSTRGCWTQPCPTAGPLEPAGTSRVCHGAAPASPHRGALHLLKYFDQQLDGSTRMPTSNIAVPVRGEARCL